ncbi:PREDICTED: uncharacterized protein LOC105626636 [Atta cephalotes]|uniref:Uncharacterized protein n=1 Tax=Atta cephalotes TaxID=12957 RepID=A0A158P0L1_ATTCE|nr:PREDICTED: uncharacterized protein LOC105626636 [Atta cephalotes]
MMKLILLLAVIVSATTLDLPSNFKTCKKSDPNLLECLTDAIKDAVVSMAKGLKSFKILPIEPLAIDSIKIGSSEGSVSLKQEYRNVKIHGLTKNMEVYNYQYESELIPADNDDGTEKDEEIREKDLLVLLVCTFIRHNARAAVGIIGTPGAIAMLKGIANYRCASSRREACP